MKTTNVVQKRVLVVEDDAGIRELLCSLLDEEGYATDAASDGLEGLTHASAHRPDVVLLDYSMPRCDGAGFAAVYGRWPNHAPVILLSASDRLTERCREVHADGCLAKPFQMDQLLDAVEHLCRPRAHAPTF